MSPTAAMNVVAVIRLTPGTVIRRLTASEPSACSAIPRSRIAISPSRKSIWRRHPSTVSRSSAGSSSSASHTRPPRPNASLIGGRPLSVRISTAWTSFLQRVRCRTSCARRARRRRSARVGSSGSQQPLQQPGGEQPRQRARVATVGLDLRLGDRPQLRPRRHDDPRHVRLQRPRDRQRVAGRLQRHVIVGAEAVGQDRKPLRAGRHAAAGPHAPRLADRDLTEIEVDV